MGLRPAGLAVGREDDLAVGEQGQSGSQKGELGPPGGCISLDPMLLFHFFQAHDIDALRWAAEELVLAQVDVVHARKAIQDLGPWQMSWAEASDGGHFFMCLLALHVFFGEMSV